MLLGMESVGLAVTGDRGWRFAGCCTSNGAVEFSFMEGDATAASTAARSTRARLLLRKYQQPIMRSTSRSTGRGECLVLVSSIWSLTDSDHYASDCSSTDTVLGEGTTPVPLRARTMALAPVPISVAVISAVVVVVIAIVASDATT